MYYELLNTGDRVLAVTTEFVTIERNDGSVVFYPIVIKDNKIHLETNATTTIGYSPADDSDETEEYVTENGVRIVNF